MAEYQQADRRFRLTTPLGADVLLLTGFRGTEGLSQLFSFELDLIAPHATAVDFAKLLGQAARIDLDLPDGNVRRFHGMISRFSQGHRDDAFVHYRMELVPKLWLLTKRQRSRVFQRKTAKEILTAVFEGIPLTWNVKDTQAVRDYCTQYRESDFDFACRLMEDEGIFYYFQHAEDGHTLVLSDHPEGHLELPVEATLDFAGVDGGADDRQNYVITTWEKAQELRTGKVTLWDHHFELPHQPLDAEGTIQNSVTVGKVKHDLRAGNVTALEAYDFPGGYADWFDGVSPGGVKNQEGDLQKIFQQNARRAKLRVQEEAAQAVRIDGLGYCGNMTAGHKFTFAGHFDADGEYVLTSVSHAGVATGDFRSGAVDFQYSNTFSCLPAALPFRPPRDTLRPTINGTQTAVVVGPPGEEIFTDPYGRVKVQFHWDREGKHDADSSCWIRVSTTWAGKGWGQIHIPRIGHEVIVGFLEGDPDRPIILGSVYNADHIPPGDLPAAGMVSGLMSRSTKGGGGSNFNGFRANDTKGSEALDVQAEYNLTTLVKNDEKHTVNNNRTIAVKVDDTESVGSNQKVDIGADRTETVGGNEKISITGNREVTISGTDKLTLTGDQTEALAAKRTVTVGGDEKLTVTGTTTIESTGAIKITSAASIEIAVGGSTIKLSPSGIEINGPKVDVIGSGPVTVTGSVVKVNS